MLQLWDESAGGHQLYHMFTSCSLIDAIIVLALIRLQLAFQVSRIHSP
ncbi:hypothetical protein [Paenibacillus periandrae]|nr:hypothetical protein [Paenibacillus periandrae]